MERGKVNIMPNRITNIQISSLYELARGWKWTISNNVCSSVRDGTHDTPTYVQEGIPLITSKNLCKGYVDFYSAKNISREDHNEISKRSGVENGDIIFAMIGTLGNPVIVNSEIEFSIKNIGLFKKNESAIKPKYLKYWLESNIFWKIIEDEDFIKGSTQKFISLNHLRNIPIPLPPLNEQRRIVAKLDSLLARTRKAREELEKIGKLCDRYKQAVLSAAFRGDLTADWRKNHPQLTLDEEFISFTNDERGWVICKAEDVCIVESGSTPKGKPFTVSGDIPYLKVYNIVEQKLNFDYEPQFIPYDVHQKTLKRSINLPGDVLINIVGLPLGKVAIVTDQFNEWNINQALVIFRPKTGIATNYLYYFLRKGYFFRKIEHRTKGSVGQVNISLTQCRNCLVPIPSREEQTEIVHRVEKLFKSIDATQQETQKALKLCDRLEQATLAKAFRGELVPQDPDDEPASVLLDRIAAEKQQTAKPPKKSRTKTPKYKQLAIDDLE